MSHVYFTAVHMRQMTAFLPKTSKEADYNVAPILKQVQANSLSTTLQNNSNNLER